jgi:uncharacterized protein YeaO (DUF488 family)
MTFSTVQRSGLSARSDSSSQCSGFMRRQIEELRVRASTGPVTVLHAARDRQHNNAVVLAELLRDR